MLDLLWQELARRRGTRSGAAALERLLKRLELPNLAPAIGLYRLIEGLRPYGLTDTGARALHALRTAANADKHDPETYQDWRETDRVLRNARNALDELDAAPIAGLHEAADRPHLRTFVVGVYDHFHTGETEFYIWPNVIDYKPPLEIFQMDYHQENEALAALERSGELRWGKEVIDDDLWNELARDTEFYRAGLFTGVYRDLVAAFAPHQHGRPLLTELQRSSNFSSVRAATLMALVDLTYDRPSAAADLSIDRLLDQVAAEYAISRGHPMVEEMGRRVLDLIAPLWADELATLKGPQWRTVADLEVQGKYHLAKDAGLAVIVRDDGTIIVGQDD